MNMYHNLTTLVRGFVEYVQSIVNYSDTEKYFPALHYNESSIEGLFLCITKWKNIVRAIWRRDSSVKHIMPIKINQ